MSWFCFVHWLLPLVHSYYGDRDAVDGEEETPFSFMSLAPGNNAVKLRIERVMFAQGPNVLISVTSVLVLMISMALLLQSALFSIVCRVLIV